ncbi:MAG: type I-B CRISPR-associated protein Cas5b [Brevinematales bacterium]
MDKLIIFDISGPFANFRKFYTNSSSSTYIVPPRTVISGLIAGIIGKPRDSYYEEFSIDNANIGVKPLTKAKKLTQTINYYNIEIKNKTLRYQVPMEILVPEKRNELVSYRVYFYHKEEEIFNDFLSRLKDRRFIYNPYLGITEFLANINFVSFLDDKSVKKVEINEEDFIEVEGCFNIKYIIKLDTSSNPPVVVNRMPIQFKENRELDLFGEYIVEKNCSTIKVKLKKEAPLYKLTYSFNGETKEENIIFME